MKYFVVSDVHGFYSILTQTLKSNGFDELNPNHKLIILGDIMDRGEEPQQMQEYLMRLISLDKVILIRGNHEDLIIDLINRYESYVESNIFYSHHYQNGTVETAIRLCQKNWAKDLMFLVNPIAFIKDVKKSSFIQTIIPKTINYFETKNYIFVHGFIPTIEQKIRDSSGLPVTIYKYNPCWRNATKKEWDRSRWLNGQLINKEFAIKEEKTIVCGHYHSSFGHYKYEKQGSEFGKNANFNPYYGDNLIAIDACTAYSGKINCIIIED